jgi:hypothetical protein
MQHFEYVWICRVHTAKVAMARVQIGFWRAGEETMVWCARPFLGTEINVRISLEEESIEKGRERGLYTLLGAETGVYQDREAESEVCE